MEKRACSIFPGRKAISALFHPSVLHSALCTRARLTSDGILRTCLLRENEVDLLTPLRARGFTG